MDLLLHASESCAHHMQRAFAYAGPSARNKLLLEVKSISTLETFKTKLRMHLYRVAYTLKVTCHNGENKCSVLTWLASLIYGSIRLRGKGVRTTAIVDKCNATSNPNPNWLSLACPTLYRLAMVCVSQNRIGNLRHCGLNGAQYIYLSTLLLVNWYK